MVQLTEEIEALLEELVERWKSMRLPEIRELWDGNEREPYYLPEEAEEPLIGWDDIEAYWQRTMAAIPRLTMRIWEVRVKPLAPDLAVALYRMHWNAEVKGFAEPLGGDNPSRGRRRCAVPLLLVTDRGSASRPPADAPRSGVRARIPPTAGPGTRPVTSRKAPSLLRDGLAPRSPLALSLGPAC